MNLYMYIKINEKKKTKTTMIILIIIALYFYPTRDQCVHLMILHFRRTTLKGEKQIFLFPMLAGTVLLDTLYSFVENDISI